jgi:hypothetical protein
MRNLTGSRTLIVGMIPLMGAALACSLGSSPATQPLAAVQPPTVEEATPAPSEAATTLASSGTGDLIDLCTLPTAEEVQAVVGAAPSQTTWTPASQLCAITAANGKVLMVQAGHSADGKDIFLAGLQSLAGLTTDPAMVALAAQIQQDAPNLQLHEMVEKALPIYQSVGYETAVVPGVSDFTYWFWAPKHQVGEITVGRAGVAWLALYTIGIEDQAASRSLLTPLAVTLLQRLPDQFQVTGETK